MKRNTGAMLALGTVFLGAGVFAAGRLIPAGSTIENLKAAYIGEINTKARYAAFSVKADEEGYAGVASLFRAVAQAEQVHAANHAKAIKALGYAALGDVEKPIVRATKENLEWVVKAENREYNIMYPDYLQQAVKDHDQQAITSFRGAMEAELGHYGLFSEAAADLEGWKVKRSFLVCQTCGHITADFSIKNCPFCAQPREQFKEYN